MNGAGRQVAGWIDDVRAQGVARVAGAFGFEVQRRGASASVPCPACGAARRHTKTGDKRAAAGLTKEGQGWRCFQCDAGGDAVTLAALAVTGSAKPEREKWADVRRACAELGLCDADPRDGRPAPTIRRIAPPPASASTLPVRPPAAEVAALWAASLRLDAMPAWSSADVWTGEARSYLSSRRFDVSMLAALDLARILPPSSGYAFPTWWPSAWSKTWRLVVPAYEPTGELASLHARAIEEATPKTRWPRDCAAAGLLMADARGRALLMGDAGELEAVVVVEGLTDMLATSLRVERKGQRRAVLSVTAGSSSAFARVRWPADVPCFLATDDDKAGEKYATEVRAALPAAVEVRRIRLNRGEK